MHCLEHKGIVAVGICKHCNKALCESCINLIEECLCCNNSNCKENMELYIEMMDKSSKIYLLGKYKNKFSIPPISVFSIIFGTLCIAFNFWRSRIYRDDFFNMFFILMGSIFIIFGLYFIFKKNKLNI